MVSIRVNDVPVEQKMRVGSDGEAYFLSELSADDNEECTSPACISPSSSMMVGYSFLFTIIKNFQDERTPSPPPMGSEPNSASSSPRKSNAYYFIEFYYIVIPFTGILFLQSQIRKYVRI